jgi:hypothetical protein
LHDRSLVGHGVGECSVEKSRNELKWCEMSLHRGRGIYMWMEDEVWIFLRFFMNILELKRSKMTIF